MLYDETVRLTTEAGGTSEALVRLRAGTTRSRGPRCLFLHGNPGSLLDWAHILPLLSEITDIAAIDMPGFGRSPRRDGTPESVCLDRLAEQVVGVLDRLSWNDPVFLVGHSHGGGVAQVAAARYPGRVAGIVLIGTLGAPTHASYRMLSIPGSAAFLRFVGSVFRSKKFLSLSRELVRRVMRDVFTPEVVDPERVHAELEKLSERPEILLTMAHVASGRPSKQLHASAVDIRCPTLFLHGEQDALVPSTHARSIHDRIVTTGGNSQWKTIPAAGHMLIEFQAKEVAAEIGYFVSNSLGNPRSSK